MTKLLVSVRDAAEAKIALEAEVDLIDIKEPRHGSLGKASAEAIEQIAKVVGGRRALSVALGELVELAQESRPQLSLPAAINFAKIGLAGCGADGSWPQRLAAVWKLLPSEIGRVAVIYADWKTASAPPPGDVLKAAVKLGCRGLLLDTYDKACPRLTSLWSDAQIGELVAAANSRQLMTVLAGRISASDVERLLQHQPDYLAVRGAVCETDRSSTIDLARTRAFRKLIAKNLEFASRCNATSA